MQNNCWKLTCLHASIVLFATVFSEITGDEEATSGPTNEEWHMDFVPTGYLPDSVYRELEWYGILQFQPLYHSTKHKVVAQWIWQNTLGRPYVILENQPQFPGKVSHQIVVEEATKWSREQRTAQDVLMENIKTGSNGLTVRTVLSANKKTVDIIQNGNYYECPNGSEPDLEAYRVQANMHERKCTFGKEPVPITIDPCVEAETATLEYSFREGWMFCNGDDECAIDSNVVITYDYFGDEPRKDLLHNTTLCTTWDPCRLSYLYRYEPPLEVPSLSIPTRDPCDTTICPECLVDTSTEIITTNTTIEQTKVKWIPATATTATDGRCAIRESADENALWCVVRAHYNNEVIPGFLNIKLAAAYIPYEGKEVPVSDFELLCDPARELKWISAIDGQVPPGAVPGGITRTGETLYIARLQPSKEHAYASYEGSEIPFKDYEVLIHIVLIEATTLMSETTWEHQCSRPGVIEWVTTSISKYASYIGRALVGGKSLLKTTRVWVIRATFVGNLLPGKLVEICTKAFVAHNGKENYVSEFELAIVNPNDVHWLSAINSEIPQGALTIGSNYNGEDFYICCVKMEKELTPGGLLKSEGTCVVGYYGKSYASKEYEMLCRRCA